MCILGQIEPVGIKVRLSALAVVISLVVPWSSGVFASFSPGGAGWYGSEAATAHRPSASRLPAHGKATGSGVVIDRDGRVLTSLHVVSGCNARLLHTGDAVIPARLSATDRTDDLAILIPERQLPAKPAVFRWKPVVQGEAVVVAGFPREVVQRGLLKAISARVVAREDPRANPAMMRLTAAVNPGTSGGPVLDRAGRVVGLVAGMLYDGSSGRPIENPGLAIRGEVLQGFLERAGIPLKTEDGRRPMSMRVIAADAAQYTVMVECLR